MKKQIIITALSLSLLSFFGVALHESSKVKASKTPVIDRYVKINNVIEDASTDQKVLQYEVSDSWLENENYSDKENLYIYYLDKDGKTVSEHIGTHGIHKLSIPNKKLLNDPKAFITYSANGGSRNYQETKLIPLSSSK